MTELAEKGAVATNSLDSPKSFKCSRSQYLLPIHAAEVSVAESVVDLRHIGEELRLLDPLERKGGLLTRVGVRPLARKLYGSVGRHLHHIILLAGSNSFSTPCLKKQHLPAKPTCKLQKLWVFQYLLPTDILTAG